MVGVQVELRFGDGEVVGVGGVVFGLRRGGFVVVFLRGGFCGGGFCVRGELVDGLLVVFDCLLEVDDALLESERFWGKRGALGGSETEGAGEGLIDLVVGEALGFAREGYFFRSDGEGLKRLGCLPGAEVHGGLLLRVESVCGGAGVEEGEMSHRVSRGPGDGEAGDHDGDEDDEDDGADSAEGMARNGRVAGERRDIYDGAWRLWILWHGYWLDATRRAADAPCDDLLQRLDGGRGVADRVRIGIDLGGTKIEGIALGAKGEEMARVRVATPRGDYEGTVRAVADLVGVVEARVKAKGKVGVGIPGTVVKGTGLVKNANSTWLNGQAFEKDLSVAMGREVRCANDANCLAVSEASDGAGAGMRVVFAVILGTGCGGGIVVDGKIHAGPNGVAGEWGHTPLPWMTAEEWPGRECYCGRRGCVETWISGTGFAAEHARVNGGAMTAEEIVAAAESGDAAAAQSMERLEGRIARSLAMVANVLDPDVIVIGGGLSKVERLYVRLPELVRGFVFGGEFDTPIRQAVHGDASGVRGAAWLWDVE